MNNYFKRSLLVLFAFLPLYLVAQSVTRVVPADGSYLLNHIGQDLEISVTFSGGVPEVDDTLFISWYNSDNPINSEVVLVASSVTYDAAGEAIVVCTFSGDDMDAAGDYIFRAWSGNANDTYPGSPATDFEEFTYHVSEDGAIPLGLLSVTMLTPTNGAKLSCTNPIILSVDVQPVDLRSMVTVDYFINGYKVNAEPSTAVDGSGVFAFSWNKPYIGTHSITARAQMSNGTFIDTVNDVDVNIVGIGSPPEITLSVPPGDNRVVGSDARFTVQAGDSGALIQTLYFYVNGVIYETIDDATALASFPYTFDFHFPAPGPYEFWVLSESSNGNRGISNVIELTVGLGSPPSVTLISPIDGIQFLPGTDIPILAQANDPNSLITRLQYFVNDTNVANATRNLDGSFTVIETSVSTSHYTYHFPFAGDYRVYVQAMDGSGMIAQSNIVTVQVRELDPTKPKVVMSHPLPVGGGDTVNDVSVGSSMFLNAIATDGDGVIKFVKFFINGQLIGSSVTHYNDVFSLYFEPTTPGAYIIFAEAVDNHGKRSQSLPIQLNVYGLEAQLPEVTLYPIADSDKIIDAGSRINLYAVANSGLVKVSQINFYVNGVLFDAAEESDGSGVYTSSIVLNQPGTYFFNVRAIEIDPLGLTTDNWVISDPVAVMVVASSSNRGFVIQTYQDIFGVSPTQTSVDQEVVALDTGQKTQAQYVYELMQTDAFAYTEQALMARYLLTGTWPNRTILNQDISSVSSTTGLDQLVNLLLPTFQTSYWGGQRIPDGFSTDQEFKDFVKILFNNKYGQNPTSAQTDRCVIQLQFAGGVSFIADFVRDTDAMQFGSGTISTILGIPNPPNTRLQDLAQAASLYINLLRITPSIEEVNSLSQLTLIERIQTILADPRFASR